MTDNTVLSILWSPPAEDEQNGAITSYSLNCSIDNDSDFELILDSAQNIFLGAFTPMTTYTCSVSASTAVGAGPSAIASTIIPGIGEMVIFILAYCLVLNAFISCFARAERDCNIPSIHSTAIHNKF